MSGEETVCMRERNGSQERLNPHVHWTKTRDLGRFWPFDQIRNMGHLGLSSMLPRSDASMDHLALIPEGFFTFKNMLCANDLKYNDVIFSCPRETGQFLGLCWVLGWSQDPRK